MSSSQPQTINASSAYAEALQKAKQIAAKINPKRALDEKVDNEPNKRVAVNTPRFYRGLEILTYTTIGSHTQLEMLVPGAKVGLIIGKGGETIKHLQDKSGAKMIVVQDGPNTEGSKPLRITGENEKVERAKEMVGDLIGDKEDHSSESVSNYGYGDSSECELVVPKFAVGLVIGKGGEMIKKIQTETGAKVVFNQLKDDKFSDQKCMISGKTSAVENARKRIQELISGAMGGQRNSNQQQQHSQHGGQHHNHQQSHHHGQRQSQHDGHQQQVSQDYWNNRINNIIEVSFTVPTSKAGIIIGKG